MSYAPLIKNNLDVQPESFPKAIPESLGSKSVHASQTTGVLSLQRIIGSLTNPLPAQFVQHDEVIQAKFLDNIAVEQITDTDCHSAFIEQDNDWRKLIHAYSDAPQKLGKLNDWRKQKLRRIAALLSDTINNFAVTIPNSHDPQETLDITLQGDAHNDVLAIQYHKLVKRTFHNSLYIALNANLPIRQQSHMHEDLQPSSLEHSTGMGHIIALVNQGKYTQALEGVVQHFHLGASDDFQIKSTSNYANNLKNNEPIPAGIPNGLTLGGRAKNYPGHPQAVIYIHEKWIKDWILNNQIGDLIDTIEHELVHVRQGNDQQFTAEYGQNQDVFEFDAYCEEIERVKQKIDKNQSNLPTPSMISQSYHAAETHLSRMGAQDKIKFEPRLLPLRQEKANILGYLDAHQINHLAEKDFLHYYNLLNTMYQQLKNQAIHHPNDDPHDYVDHLNNIINIGSTGIETAYSKINQSRTHLFESRYKESDEWYEDLRYADQHNKIPMSLKPKRQSRNQASSSSNTQSFLLAPPPGFNVASSSHQHQFDHKHQESDDDDDWSDFHDATTNVNANNTTNDDDWAQFDDFN